MLPIENLDDRTFKEIMDNARRAISRLNPEWSDENFHDPGITLLEILAWVTEIQQYRLNRITHLNELKFLRLLGEKPRLAQPAQTYLTFAEAGAGFCIPGGTQLSTGNLVFETLKRIFYHPLTIEKVMVMTGKETMDFTSPNRYSRSGYPVFGREAKKGNRILIGLDRPIQENRPLDIHLDLFDAFPVPRGKGDENELKMLPSGKVAWKYFGWDGQGGAWLPLKIVNDESINFSRDGILEIIIESPMEPLKINPANDKPRYWLQCEVAEEGYETVPRLTQITLNTVGARQTETLCSLELRHWDGSQETTFIFEDFPQYFGINELQVQDDSGNWVYWQEVNELQQLAAGSESFYIEKEPAAMRSRVILSPLEEAELNQLTHRNIRFISYLPQFAEKRLIGQGNGLPNEAYYLPEGLSGVHSLRIQIGSRVNNEQPMVWQDWTQVEDLDASGPDDRHFVLDTAKGLIYFGNDEHGAIPEPADIDNICIISCITTAGSPGNIKENNPFEFGIAEGNWVPCRVANLQVANGGKDAETLESAKERILREYYTPTRAVSAADYEALALETPGVRIACAKAIPCFSPHMPGYPETKAEGQVSVVVIPYSDKERPLPSKNLLKNVQRHLEDYRLIGTQIHVIPPEYLEISVRAIIMVRTRDFNKSRMVAALDNYLEPFRSIKGVYKWDFNGTVFKSDILGLLNKIPGVEYVSELWLMAEGSGARVTAAGDVELPPYGLPVAGSYEIEVKDVNE